MGQTEYTAAVLADSPQAFYKMDEPSGLPQDSSGNGNHFTSSNGTANYQVRVPFTGAQSIRLSSTDNFSRAILSTTLENFTIEFWGNAILSATIGRFITMGVANTNGWRLSAADFSARRALRITVDPADDQTISGSNYNLSGNFLYTVVTNEEGIWNVFLAGDLHTSNISLNAFTTPTGNFTLGSSASGPIEEISNVAYYDHVVSSTRIRAHYEAAINYSPSHHSVVSPWRIK